MFLNAERRTDLAVAGGLIIALVLVIAAEARFGSLKLEGGGSLITSGSKYGNRDPEKRKQVVQQYGGSPATELAAAEGLDWLARHQSQDGHWGPDCLGEEPTSRCTGETACTHPGHDYRVAQTGLALLAFQAGGHVADRESKYSGHVRRGLDWLAAEQKADGGLFVGEAPHHHYIYEHAIAAFALAEACALSRAEGREADPRYLTAATRAVELLCRQQKNDGGWRYGFDYPGEGGDTSVTGWAVLALEAAHEANIDYDPAVVTRATEFFRNCEYGDRGQTGYVVGGGPYTDATTGVGMLFQQFLLKKPRSPLVLKAAPYLAEYAESRWGEQTLQPPDYYLWYNCTLAMFQAGGDDWDRWNRIVLQQNLLPRQVHEGCERGSWPSDDPYGDQGGRVYSTALSVLMLEVYYRYTRDEAETDEADK